MNIDLRCCPAELELVNTLLSRGSTVEIKVGKNKRLCIVEVKRSVKTK